MIPAIETSLDEDLSEFSRILWQKKLSHRIFRFKQAQILAVPKHEQISEVIDLYQQWHAGGLQAEREDSADFSGYFSGRQLSSSFLRVWFLHPLTISLILVCVALAFLVPLGTMSDTLRLFLYPDFSYGTRTINLPLVLERFSFMQFLKMMSPILLHAGLLHLSFNMLWLWEFGRRIERIQNSLALLLLIIVLALVSNTAQYLYSGSIYFGGMSGVVYGLFAYIWMWQLFDPAKGLGLPPALVFFMLLALIILTMIGLEGIADTAHIAGLLAGVVSGATVATISRIRRATAARGG